MRSISVGSPRLFAEPADRRPPFRKGARHEERSLVPSEHPTAARPAAQRETWPSHERLDRRIAYTWAWKVRPPERRGPRPIFELLDAEGRTRARWSRGKDGVRPGTRTSRGSCMRGTSQEISRPDDRDGPAHDFDPPSKKGRAVLRGRPLRGPPCTHTDLFDRPCGRPHHVVLPHRGSQVPGAGGSSLGAVCP